MSSRRRLPRWLLAIAVTAVVVVLAAVAAAPWVLPQSSAAQQARATRTASGTPVASATASASAGSATPVASPAQAPVAISPGTTLRVVGLGDSVMAGTHCDCDGIPSELATAIGRKWSVATDATNLGAGGYTTADLLADLKDDATTRRAVARADVVVVSIGANDLYDALSSWKDSGCGRSCYNAVVSAMQGRLNSILAAITSLAGSRPQTVLVDGYWNVFTDGKVALQQGGWTQLSWSRAVTASVNQAIKASAARADDTFVDLRPVFTNVPDPLLASDGDHPNAAGVQAIVAANLAALSFR